MAITIEKILLLRQLPVFDNVSDEALADFMMMAEEKTFKVGEKIISEGQKYAPLFVVLDGHLEVLEAKKVVAEYTQGNICGLTTVFNPQPSSNAVRAQSKTVVLKIGKDALYHLFVQHPSLAFCFLALLSEKKS